VLKYALKLFAAAAATLVLAAILLARSINGNLDAMSVSNGDWSTSVGTGSKDAGVLLKASVALGGLLASTRENSIYYRLYEVDGEPLRLNCRYRIKGGDYDADWWSITAYGWDNYLIPNAEKRYSFNNETLTREANGEWEIVVHATKQPGNWLPIGPSAAPEWRNIFDYDFDLLLRLYTPGRAYLDDPQSADLPTVTRESCE
jgi:hypothetical protein